MMRLAEISLVMGAIAAATHGACLFMPDGMKKGIERFPRSRWAGVALTAVDMTWICLLLHTTTLGWLTPIKPWLPLLGPLAFVVVILFMDDLLAARALGGLFLLAPAPILAAARWHPSVWRYAPIVIAYVLVVKGLILVVSPFRFRQAWAVVTASPFRVRACGAAGLGVGALLVGLGLTVF